MPPPPHLRAAAAANGGPPTSGFVLPHLRATTKTVASTTTKTTISKTVVKADGQPEDDSETCYVCKPNLVFRNWDDFAKHKVDSKNHICCNVCYRDFKTNAALKEHRTQFHPADQDLTCFTCGQSFDKLGALVAHTELKHGNVTAIAKENLEASAHQQLARYAQVDRNGVLNQVHPLQKSVTFAEQVGVEAGLSASKWAPKQAVENDVDPSTQAQAEKVGGVWGQGLKPPNQSFSDQVQTPAAISPHLRQPGTFTQASQPPQFCYGQGGQFTSYPSSQETDQIPYPGKHDGDYSHFDRHGNLQPQQTAPLKENLRSKSGPAHDHQGDSGSGHTNVLKDKATTQYGYNGSQQDSWMVPSALVGVIPAAPRTQPSHIAPDPVSANSEDNLIHVNSILGGDWSKDFGARSEAEEPRNIFNATPINAPPMPSTTYAPHVSSYHNPAHAVDFPALPSVRPSAPGPAAIRNPNGILRIINSAGSQPAKAGPINTKTPSGYTSTGLYAHFVKAGQPTSNESNAAQLGGGVSLYPDAPTSATPAASTAPSTVPYSQMAQSGTASAPTVAAPQTSQASGWEEGGISLTPVSPSDTPATIVVLTIPEIIEKRKHHGKASLTIMEERQLYNTKRPGFNIKEFYNSFTQKYHCHYCKCLNKSFPTPQQFLGHLNAPVHTNDPLICARCLRQYFDATALTQHIESQGIYCTVRESDNFEAIVEDVTAKMATVAENLNEDETVKYAVQGAINGADIAANIKKSQKERDDRTNSFWDNHKVEW